MPTYNRRSLGPVAGDSEPSIIMLMLFPAGGGGAFVLLLLVSTARRAPTDTKEFDNRSVGWATLSDEEEEEKSAFRESSR